MSLLKNFGKVVTACKKEYRKKRFGEFELMEGYSEGSLLCAGDNEDLMKYLLQKRDMAGKIQQIYIDPPFFSKATYDATVKVTNADGDEIKIKKRAYEDIWEEGMEEYLKMMGVRLMLMKDLLADTGTIWVHLDWHGVYYVKVLMDEIFGEKNFVNEIVWTYKSGGSSKSHFARKHDSPLFNEDELKTASILSDSAAPGAYTWPRLMVIPCYLLFAAVGDKMQGRLVPLTTLVIALAATLNAVLAGSSGASAWLNMCLFYCAVAATVSYYTLTFWRLAPGTRHPALWACMGRVLDSAMVLVTAAVRLDTLPPAAVMGLDLAGVALIILMMALSGDFNLNAAIAAEAPTAVEVPAVPEAPVSLSPEDTLEKMRQRYSLTPRETEVLRQLVMTEDKQTAIAERLSIQVKTLQDYVTRLYRKTGAATRAGLTDLYHENRQQR